MVYLHLPKSAKTVEYISEDWPGLMMKEQVLCPSCLASGLVDEAGYCAIGQDGLQECKRNKDHEAYPANLEGTIPQI